MKILIFCDIYGRIGRTAFLQLLPSLKQTYSPDCIIANIDNISSGRGAIEEHIRILEKSGVDVMCSGDHFFDNETDLQEYMANKDCNLIRPANFYEVSGLSVMGKGYKIIEKKWKKIAVIHLMGQIFMKYEVYNPFLKLQELLELPEIKSSDVVIVDFHKEATSEVWAMGRIFDGKVSVVYGTHTHIQTNDDEILPKGSGFISDVWMCWPKNSVIWASLDSVKWRFMTWLTKGKIVQSLEKDYVIQGLFVETHENDRTTLHIEKIKLVWTL